MIHVSLGFVLLMVAGIFLAYKFLRKVQLYWLRDTNTVRLLRILEERAAADVERGAIGRRVHLGIRHMIHHEYILSVDGWRRKSDASYAEDARLTLTGMCVGVEDVVGKKYGSATAQATHRWFTRQSA